MKISVLPNTLVFEGIMDEETSITDLNTAMTKLTSGGVKPPVTVDFSAVPYANSIAVVVWLKFIIAAKVMFKYVNAPVWLVNQFNMIGGYFESASFVESLQTPFFCPKTQESRSITIHLGKDIPILKDYTGFEFPVIELEGKEYEMDVSPPRYFSFISENYDLFKAKFK